MNLRYLKRNIYIRNISSIFAVKPVETETILGEFYWFHNLNVYVAEILHISYQSLRESLFVASIIKEYEELWFISI